MGINAYNIAIDSGKWGTKSVYKIGGVLDRQLLRTKVQLAKDLDVDIVSSGSFLVEFEGVKWLVGSMVGEERTNFDLTKHSSTHQLAIYLSIAQMFNRLGWTPSDPIPGVNLVINAPFNMYKNAQAKTSYADFVQNGHKPVSIRVNGKPFTFLVHMVVIAPEGTGPIYSHMDDFRRTRAHVFDIGSLNVNIATYEKLVPKLDSMVVGNLGTSLLKANIQQSLSSRYGVAVSEDDAQLALEEQVFSRNGSRQPQSTTLIRDKMRDHVEAIVNFAKGQGLTLNSTLVWAGGGSVLLKPIITSLFPHGVVDSAGSFSNVMSFYNILEAKCGVESRVR